MSATPPPQQNGSINPFLTPLDGDPGVVVTPDGKKYRLGSSQKQPLYDEVLLPAGAMPANEPFPFFAATTSTKSKNALSTNLRSQSKIPSGTIYRMEGCGLRVVETWGNLPTIGSDVKKILANNSLDFKINSIQIALGPAVFWPPGYGLTGQTQESGQSVIANGFPSETSIAGMLSPIVINDQYELIPIATFGSRPWDTTAGLLMINLAQPCYYMFNTIGTQFVAGTL